MAESDGSVRLDVDLNINKAEKALAMLNRKIEQKQNELNRNSEKRTAIGIDFNETGAKLDDVIEKVKYLKEKVASTTGDKKVLYKEELAEAVEEQRILTKETNRISAEYEKIGNQIETGKVKLAEMKEEAGLLQKTIDEGRPAEEMKARITSIKGGMKSIMKYAFGIRSIFILVNRLRTGIKEAFNAYAAEDPVMKKQITELKASLAQLKLSWGAAFAPIVSAVLPVLQKLIAYATSAANAVARLFAILSGKATYKKAIANANELAGSVGGVGAAAAEAKKELMGIDELTIWDDNKSGGGGGGGGYAGADLVDEATNTGDMSFISRLAFSIQDVLFDWKDLNAEQLMQKAVAACDIAAGAYLGWKVGGFKGAVLGGVLGLIFSLFKDAVSFNHDGELSLEEIVKSILPTVATWIGIASGHPVIGFTLGLILTLAVEGFGDPIKGKGKEAVEEYLAGIEDEFNHAKPGTYEYQYYQRWIEYANRTLEEGGDDVGKKSMDGLAAGVASKEDETSTSVKSVFGRIIQKIKDLFGIASPSKVFAEIGGNLVKGMDQGIHDRWMSFSTGLINKFNSLKTSLSNIVDKIKSLFNFEFKLPSMKLPHISISWDQYGGGLGAALLHFLGFSAIPHLSVSWYARGGIVDGATLFGAGEAGAEAIVPLERNTQWIDMVASGIMDRIPALANGSIIPPNSTGNGRGVSEDLIWTLISEVTSAVYANANIVSNEIRNKNADINLDGMTLARRMYNSMQKVANEHGPSLVNIGSR